MPAAIESYKKLIQAGDLPPLSQVGLEISRLGERDDLSASDLARLISKDPALAAKVLRIANSPFYGLRTQVKTLDHAIMVLGQISIVSICAAFTLLGALKMPQTIAHQRYGSLALRSHSVLAAILARWLAQRFASPHVPVADSFLGGLLHDIGELGIAVYYGKHLEAIHQYELDHPDAACYQAEHAILGFDHQELGAEVLNYWHLPHLYIELARHHHDAAYAVDTGEGMMVALLQAADRLAVVLKGSVGDPGTPGQDRQGSFQEPVQSAISAIQGVPPGIVDKLEKDIGRILEEAKAMAEQSVT
ncbi:MAG TPA: HDOD domain-containing protein [Nitrospiraceae bacterium]|nr:HDOD domain-containing protein [Nitrospiraceae bacterium]